ncbi:MAG: hypothetical protein IKD37_00910 [Clostridia bacterium]|nr:hypothetical protein [Clostridia bacterium]
MKRRRLPFLILVCICACILPACAPSAADGSETTAALATLAGRCYLYEEDGFGGSFTVTLFDDGSFSYYEGMLSSHIGYGKWAQNGDILTLTESEETGHGGDFRFRCDEETLTYLADRSQNFIYVRLADGAVFRLADAGRSIYVSP